MPDHIALEQRKVVRQRTQAAGGRELPDMPFSATMRTAANAAYGKP
jgi:hypothetical protein